ncbi:MAG: PH domain-containing protein [Actinobacteria bacterium]|nr:PH domain-containing protein [Actinomycetota bacterium]
MGLLDNLMGNASDVDAASVQEDLSDLLLPDEKVEVAFAVFRDLFVFSSRRLLLVDKQGMTGKKVEYHSVPYRAITQFKVETAGTFDAEAELEIHVSGGAAPIRKTFGKKSNIMGVQKALAEHVL